ncbi:MAG: roadblock/LC7 domain-containing protein [Thermoleophilia bacterium]|nr:roadblock/LC7 domain-containing protein [Thermoleophilia bacterium]
MEKNRIERDELEAIIRPYTEIEGIDAAGLSSLDGLLVAWSGDNGPDPEVIAAHAASMLASFKTMAEELGTTLPRLLNLELTGHDLILAPLNRDLVLILVGRKDAIGKLTGKVRASV